MAAARNSAPPPARHSLISVRRQTGSGILDIANSRFRQGSLRAVKQIPEPVADGAGDHESGQRIGSGGAQYAVTGTTSVSEQRLSRLGGLIARRLADILRH
jgi:hypothetical protein